MYGERDNDIEMNVKVTRHENGGCNLVPQDRVAGGRGAAFECGNEPSGFVKRGKFLDEMSGCDIVLSVRTVLEQVFTTLVFRQRFEPASSRIKIRSFTTLGRFRILRIGNLCLIVCRLALI